MPPTKAQLMVLCAVHYHRRRNSRQVARFLGWADGSVNSMIYGDKSYKGGLLATGLLWQGPNKANNTLRLTEAGAVLVSQYRLMRVNGKVRLGLVVLKEG